MTDARKMLGTTTRLAWGALELGIGRTYGDWNEFNRLPEKERNEKLQRYRGCKVMHRDILKVLQSKEDRLLECATDGWFGMFSSLDILLGVRAVSKDGIHCFSIPHKKEN